MKKFFCFVAATLFALSCGAGSQAMPPTSDSIVAGHWENIGVEDFARLVESDGVRLVDVRTPNEYAEGHLERAENIDVKSSDFADQTKDFSGTVAVYCLRGKRGQTAAERLAAQGCTVYNLQGGINAWKQAGRPLVK